MWPTTLTAVCEVSVPGSQLITSWSVVRETVSSEGSVDSQMANRGRWRWPGLQHSLYIQRMTCTPTFTRRFLHVWKAPWAGHQATPTQTAAHREDEFSREVRKNCPISLPQARDDLRLYWCLGTDAAPRWNKGRWQNKTLGQPVDAISLRQMAIRVGLHVSLVPTYTWHTIIQGL